MGAGAGAEVVVVVVVEIVVEDAAFFSDRVEYMAAVSPAPVAALAAAIKAKVVFDILTRGDRQGVLGDRPNGYILLLSREEGDS